MSVQSKNKTKKNRILSSIPFFRNSARNDDNIDRAKKKSEKTTSVSVSIDEEFDSALKELREYVVGQYEYTEQLIKAFKRPFFIDNGKSYANLSFVFGANGSGRYYAIKVLTILLKKKKLLKNADIYNLDFDSYGTDANADKLLLPDLYKAFYGKAEVIVINNFDKACSKVQDSIVSLVEEGSVKVDKRFNWNKGDLQEVSGAYSLGTMNSLSANGKYIFILSEKDEKYLSHQFPHSFVTEIVDVLHSIPLSDEVLEEILSSFLVEMQEKVKDNLGINVLVQFEEKIIVPYVDHNRGCEFLHELTDKKIVNALGNLVLNGSIPRNSSVTLKIIEQQIFADSFYLTDIRKSMDEKAIAVAKNELNKIIGLSNVKQFLNDIELQIRADYKRGINSGISKHMIFLGNPGTGKTTVARIVAKWFKALGFLSGGHLVETSRADFIGQYVGETPQKTMAVLKRAKGGVLFIDEAYSLSRGKGDSFGLEAVDIIVKYMEDNRDDLIIILAGYSNEMADFLKTNSGLKSRFNYSIEFPDYSSEELYEITEEIAKSKNYVIDSQCRDALIDYYSTQKKLLKNESGNGRMARNTVERAVVSHIKRVFTTGNSENMILSLTDFDIEDKSIDEKEILRIKKGLESIIGQEKVKTFVKQIESQIRYEKQYKMNISVSKHMIFLGNPGTGKTTIARIIAEYFKALGFLSSGHFIEADRSTLVGQYVGETAQKVIGIIQKAMGGVLFIDEAYSLIRTKGDQYGLEAVDTLVKALEDYRDNLVVILAGYTNEMEVFLDSNSGLRSRFNHTIVFQDYNANELISISEKIAQDNGFSLHNDVKNLLLKYYEMKQKESADENGNGRMARNVIEKAIMKHSERMMLSEDGLLPAFELTVDDFSILQFNESNKEFDLEKELSAIVGMDSIKEFIRSLQSLIKLNEARKKLGLTVDNSQSLHMVFMGNPGTGKTSMARIIAKMLFSMGILETDNLVETDRAGLVAGYVGQTAIKTKQVIQSALGGVLFVDEAYTLASKESSGNDFGQEAIDTLVKDMDDNRERLVVILAGYKNNMIGFLQSNPGLTSRFPNIVEFEDYKSEELVGIAKGILSAKGFVLGNGCEEELRILFEMARNNSDFGNGRYARNVCEQAIRNLSVRVSNYSNLTKELLSTIELSDIEQCKAKG